MFLITGATGLIGRPLVDVLLAEGVPVRAVSRDPGAAGLPTGVELVAGDPRRPEMLAGALQSISALFVHPSSGGRTRRSPRRSSMRGTSPRSSHGHFRTTGSMAGASR